MVLCGGLAALLGGKEAKRQMRRKPRAVFVEVALLSIRVVSSEELRWKGIWIQRLRRR